MADGPGSGTDLRRARTAPSRQGKAADALSDFRACAAMVSPQTWGLETRDIGYLHVRSGTALALLQLGDRDRARALARAEVEDVRAAGARRALGVALRVAGLAEGGTEGLALLGESVTVLRRSPAVLERAHSLCSWRRRCAGPGSAPKCRRAGGRGPREQHAGKGDPDTSCTACARSAGRPGSALNAIMNNRKAMSADGTNYRPTVTSTRPDPLV